MSRKILEGLAQAVNLKGSVWHFMDPETVAGYGPWVRKEDHDAALAEAAAEIARLREALADPRVAARTICDEILQKPSVAAAEMRMSMIKATLGVKVPALTSVVRWQVVNEALQALALAALTPKL